MARRGRMREWGRKPFRRAVVPVTREPRLFTQNIGGRQIERLCTAAEACPVLVSESSFQRDEGPVNGGGNYDPQQIGGVESGYMLGTRSLQPLSKGKS